MFVWKNTVLSWHMWHVLKGSSGWSCSSWLRKVFIKQYKPCQSNTTSKPSITGIFNSYFIAQICLLNRLTPERMRCSFSPLLCIVQAVLTLLNFYSVVVRAPACGADYPGSFPNWCIFFISNNKSRGKFKKKNKAVVRCEPTPPERLEH